MNSEKIRSVEMVGDAPSVDLEIDHECHNFIANGIVVSNSHAAAYASLTAVTAYLKANYPLEFYLALLQVSTEEAKQQEIIGTIFGEMRRRKLDLLPPHLLKSDLDFKIEDKRSIRFGLSSIKGIGEKAKQSILKMQHLRSANNNLFEFFVIAKESKIDIGSLSALIQAGAYKEKALNRTNSRIVLDAQLWNLLSEAEKKEALEIGAIYNYDMVEILKAKRDNPKTQKRGPFSASRIETIRKSAAKYIGIYKQNSKVDDLASLFYQNRLIGFCHDMSLHIIYKKKYPGLMSIDEFSTLRPNGNFKFMAQIKEVKNGLSRKVGANGNRTRYLKVKVSDAGEELYAFLYNDKIDWSLGKNGRALAVDDIVFVEGKKWNDAVSCERITIQDNKIYTRLSAYTKDVNKGALVEEPTEELALN